MTKNTNKPVATSFTFDGLVQYGLECGACVNAGMPTVFEYDGHLIAYDANDECFVISTATKILRCKQGEVLTDDGKGNLSINQEE